MKKYRISGFGDCIIYNIFLDLNGTINFYGKRHPDLKQKIEELKNFFNIYIISANTRGDLKEIADELDIIPKEINKEKPEQEGKLEILSQLDSDSTIVIGNGNNDVKVLKEAKIGIAIIGQEGASKNAILAADIIVSDIFDAFNLILDENALKATLRY